MLIEDPRVRRYAGDAACALAVIGLLCCSFAFLLGLAGG
jgi:hypothetical protein